MQKVCIGFAIHTKGSLPPVSPQLTADGEPCGADDLNVHALRQLEVKSSQTVQKTLVYHLYYTEHVLTYHRSVHCVLISQHDMEGKGEHQVITWNSEPKCII